MNPTRNVAEHVDIAIVGGGLVGLAFARLLIDLLGRQAGRLRIALIEARPPRPVHDVEPDLRVSAVAPAAQAILSRIGVWQQLEPHDYCRYSRMRVWQAEGSSDGARSIYFDAAELGVAELGHIVNNDAMRRIAWNGIDSLRAPVALIGESPVSLISVAHGWRIKLNSGKQLQARLLVAADGTNSWVRSELGVTVRHIPHGQRAIVARICSQRDHQQTAWQRFLRTGPVALLPLQDGALSLVWSCPDAMADELLALPREQFSARLTDATDHVLGGLECDSSRLSFPLASAQAATYTGRRYALIGDAAHQVHPLAGQGLNLGLLDAAVLAEGLASHLQLRSADPGDRMVLRRYERSRKGDNVVTQRMMMALNSLFTSELAAAGGDGLAMIDRLDMVKNRLAHYAMGGSRELPEVARSSD